MITLAVLYWLASHVGGEVGKEWFYESLPVDPDTGAVVGHGVYAMTEQAPRDQGEDNHAFIVFYVLAGEDLEDADGNPVPEKEATDQIIDAIEETVTDALDDPTAWQMTIPTTGEQFTDVRVTLSTSKETMPLMANGAVVKSLQIEVWYKRLPGRVSNGQ